MSHTPQTTDKQRSHMASEIVLSFYTVHFFPVFNVIIVRTHRREMQLFSVPAVLKLVTGSIYLPLPITLLSPSNSQA